MAGGATMLGLCLLLVTIPATAQEVERSYLPAFFDQSGLVIVFPESGHSREASFEPEKCFPSDARHPALADTPGAKRSFRGGECGSVDLDAKDRSHRVFQPGTPSDCRGLRSPDRSRAIYFDGNHLHLYDLQNQIDFLIEKIVLHPKTPANGSIKSAYDEGLQASSWSPDGRYFAFVHERLLYLIEAANPDHPRFVGKAEMGVAAWSPDSTRLLLRKGELRCAPTLYWESVATLDVKTGKTKTVRSSHCEVIGGPIGWVDSTLGL